MSMVPTSEQKETRNALTDVWFAGEREAVVCGEKYFCNIFVYSHTDHPMSKSDDCICYYILSHT